MLYELKFKNYDGDTIQFGGGQITFNDTVLNVSNSSSNPYSLIRFEGFGEVEANIQTQKAPFQDGSSHLDTVLDEKYPYVEFVIRANNFEELSQYRRHVSKVFNPKIGGHLELSYDGQTFVIDAIPEHAPFFPDDGEDSTGKIQTVTVDFICPNPYWRSTRITEEPAFKGLFQFPFEGEFEMGIQRDERIIHNDGDAPAPINVIFYGPAQTPTIANLTTGEFIKINRPLGENEKFIVDTSDENKSVYFEDENGEQTNVFHWIDLDSTFFKLQVGENEISCMCATSNLSKDFEIYYHKLYTAV